MVQTARPNSDLAYGGWTNHLGGYPLYSYVSDSSDSTQIFGGDVSDCRMGMSAVTDPNIHTGHTLYTRAASITPSGYYLSLYCGATYIKQLYAGYTNQNTTYSVTLSSGEAATITNYSDLNVYCSSNDVSQAVVYDIWFEVPDPSTPANVTAGNKAAITTVPTPTVTWTRGAYLYTPDLPVQAWVPQTDPGVSVEVGFLDPPGSLAATPIGDDRIDLSWSAVEGASVYDVERDGVTLHPPVSGTFYSDTGLEPARTYTYRVRARP